MSVRLEGMEWRRAEFFLRAEACWAQPVTQLSGASGAGKTTLLELIAGLRRPDRGRVWLGGEVVAESKGGRWVPPERRGVGYVPQDLALFPHLSVQANLEFGRRARAPEGPLKSRVFETLEIGPLLLRSVHQLSGGEKQRVALGRALLARPRLLLLDEPLTGLEDRLKEQILGALRTVVEEFGVPVVYVSHSQKELESIGGESYVLTRGVLSPGRTG